MIISPHTHADTISFSRAYMYMYMCRLRRVLDRVTMETKPRGPKTAYKHDYMQLSGTAQPDTTSFWTEAPDTTTYMYNV